MEGAGEAEGAGAEGGPAAPTLPTRGLYYISCAQQEDFMLSFVRDIKPCRDRAYNDKNVGEIIVQ